MEAKPSIRKNRGKSKREPTIIYILQMLGEREREREREREIQGEGEREGEMEREREVGAKRESTCAIILDISIFPS